MRRPGLALPAPLGRVSILLILANGLLAAWLFAHPGNPTLFLAGMAFGQGICGLLAGLICLLGSQVGGRRHWPSFLFGLSNLCYGVGALLWLGDTLVLQRAVSVPSLGDTAYLVSYPLCLAGLLTLPRRPVSGAVRACVILDGILIMIATVTFSWYFILGPIVLQAEGSTLTKVFELIYPLSDLTLACCLLFLLSPANGLPRTGAYILTLSLGMVILADSYFAYNSLHGTYRDGRWPDLFWPLAHSIVTLGLVAIRSSTGEPPQPNPGRAMHLWQALLPYTFLPAVAGLLAYTWSRPGDEALGRGVLLGSAALLLVILLRQVLALVENGRLQRATASYAQRLESLNTTLQATRDELAANNTALLAANERLEALATTDPLTGLPNQQSIAATLDRELARARRHDRSSAVLFFDLDHFKALNDSYGHAAGDAILSELATIVRAALRAGDHLGRWGGEEFVALLPELPPEGAVAAAERIRRAVADHSFAAGGGVHLTCSIGVAVFPRDASEHEALIALADRAMYAAKRLGRNQVREAHEPAVVALPGEWGQSESRETTALLGIVEALAALAETREHRDGPYADAIVGLIPRLATALGMNATEARMVGLAGRLHDIGKIALPDTVIRKSADLTSEEWAIIRDHPLIGAEVVSHIPALRGLAPLIRAHHERWDGTGYPDGLAGEAIPLGARLLAVVDAFDAMTSTRPHQPAWTIERALAELRRYAGTQFDPTVVAALDTIIATAPIFAQPARTSTLPILA